jgi:hypothetical protein
MVASPQSGFGQILFDPDPDPAHPTQSCAVQPYAFHPMYATSSEHTRTTWAAHSFNVAFSDEIGHFEFCDAADFRTFRCTVPGVDEPDGKLDADDFPCITPAHPAFPPPPFQQIGGCLGSDVDFDGVPYKLSWAGTLSDRTADQQIHAEPIRFTSPLFFGGDGLENFSRVAFETDLPGIEVNCNRTTGANCVNPPSGAAFYPIYTTRGGKRDDDEHEKTRGRNSDDDRHEDTCTWQLGGRFVPGTTNDFGGTSTAEYGDMLKLFFPFRGGSFTSIQDFRRIINHNPCRARLGDRFEDAIDQLVHVDD